MEKIVLKALEHRGQECIGLYFAKNPTLQGTLRKTGVVKWSQTHKCWYTPMGKAYYNKIYHAIKGLAIFEQSALHRYLTEKKKRNNISKLASLLSAAVKSGKAFPANKQVPAPTREAAKHLPGTIHPVNAQVLPMLKEQLTLKVYSSSTIKTYINEMAQLLQVLRNVPAHQLTTADLKRYLVYCIEKLGLKENTLHSRINAMKFYYEQVLGREKFFWEIPRPKKPIKLPKVISEEKIIKGLGSIENLKHKTLLLLAYSAGMRVSEVVALKITDINSDRMQITINDAKGKKDRVVTLSKVMLQLLRNYYKVYKPKDWLFEGQYDGEHYSKRSAQIIFKEAYQKLNLPPQCSFHSLRHSYATHLLKNGTDIAYIQKLLGHNDIKTTLRYTQVSNRDIKKIESPLDKILRGKSI